MLAKPPPTWVPHNDNAVAVNQLRGLSDGLRSTQRGGQITRARAEEIAASAGTNADVVLDVLARSAQNDALAPTFADMAAAANAAQDRAHLLEQDNLMGQLQLQVRNNAQMGRVVAQAAQSLPTAHAAAVLQAQQNVAQQIAAQNEAEQVPLPDDDMGLDVDG